MYGLWRFRKKKNSENCETVDFTQLQRPLKVAAFVFFLIKQIKVDCHSRAKCFEFARRNHEAQGSHSSGQRFNLEKTRWFFYVGASSWNTTVLLSCVRVGFHSRAKHSYSLKKIYSKQQESTAWFELLNFSNMLRNFSVQLKIHVKCCSFIAGSVWFVTRGPQTSNWRILINQQKSSIHLYPSIINQRYEIQQKVSLCFYNVFFKLIDCFLLNNVKSTFKLLWFMRLAKSRCYLLIHVSIVILRFNKTLGIAQMLRQGLRDRDDAWKSLGVRRIVSIKSDGWERGVA